MGKQVELENTPVAEVVKKPRAKKSNSEQPASDGAKQQKTRPVEVVAIFPSLRDALLNYLQTRPFGEVANLYQALQTSQVIIAQQTVEDGQAK